MNFTDFDAMRAAALKDPLFRRLLIFAATAGHLAQSSNAGVLTDEQEEFLESVILSADAVESV